MAIGGRAGEVFTEINVTPLTDVFLVLLVIMILIAPQINQTVLKVSPPDTSTNSPPPPKDEKQLKVTVEAPGTIMINDKPANPADVIGCMTLIKQFQTEYGTQDLPLSLQSDPEAKQRAVVAVMDAATGCGITKLNVLPLKAGVK